MDELINQTRLQILSLFLANSVLIIWFRAESRNDWRHMDNKVDSIQKEMKDFHIRLEKQDAEFKAHMINIFKSKQ